MITTLSCSLKGLRNRGERAYIDDIFSKIDHRLISISDEGYDINAYLYVAKKLDHDYVLFCNTHTEILSDGWLSKMVAAAELENVGLVGATASYESISISQKLISKAVWLATNRKLPFDDEFYKSFRRYLDFHCQKWVRSGKFSRRLLKGELFREPFSGPINLADFDDEYDDFWARNDDDRRRSDGISKISLLP